MNGATAEPCVRKMRPPNSTMITTIGSSQNFLRSRMNAHSSSMNSMSLLLLELPEHMCARSRDAADAVRVIQRGVLPPHRVLLQEPHQSADRCDHGKE